MGLAYDPEEAVRTLSNADQTLGQLIRRVGPVAIRPPARLNPFEALARSIVYQQLSGKAAGTIYGRVRALFPKGRTIKPAEVLKTPEEALRGAGMSRAKVASVKDLAAQTLAGVVPSGAQLRKMPDEAIVDRLTQVRGIGVWTVQMLLIFDLGRPDVLPVLDLGVRKGFMLTYGLADLPGAVEMEAHCACWQPYRSVGSWYMWRAVEEIKK